MQFAPPLNVKDGNALLLVGTTKGLFIMTSNLARSTWQISGPHFPGHAVYALAYDSRGGRHRIWAAVQSMHFGALLRSSDDFGRTWTQPEAANVKFPGDSGVALKQIWQIALAPADRPNTLFCGVEPAALFESNDAGETWSLVRGLFDHPHRSRWEPGGGGLCLHTIVPDPSDARRMHVAISTGGVYRTLDGGRSWEPCNRGIRAEYLPEKYPEFGQCVHKVVTHPMRPGRFFLQNHFGLYRSDDGGDSWSDIARGVPSDFGFAMAMHPHDLDTVYALPLESDQFRCVPEAKLRVYRTRDGGGAWEPLTKGLPQKNAFETVLRDGMAADSLQPAGIYFGTRSGKLYGSRNEGGSWQVIADTLPPVVCLKTGLVGEPKSKASKPRAKKEKPSRRGKRSTGKRARA
jgi:photosystem II stability/assembly factor-like uncharacterized protein